MILASLPLYKNIIFVLGEQLLSPSWLQTSGGRREQWDYIEKPEVCKPCWHYTICIADMSRSKLAKMELRNGLTLLFISDICSFKALQDSVHSESLWLHLFAHAFFNAVRHAFTCDRISLLSSTHSGAHLFLARILNKVSSAGSAWGLLPSSSGFPFPGKFSNCPSFMDCHILCSAMLMMSVSDLSNSHSFIHYSSIDSFSLFSRKNASYVFKTAIQVHN